MCERSACPRVPTIIIVLLTKDQTDSDEWYKSQKTPTLKSRTEIKTMIVTSVNKKELRDNSHYLVAESLSIRIGTKWAYVLT